MIVLIWDPMVAAIFACPFQILRFAAFVCRAMFAPVVKIANATVTAAQILVIRVLKSVTAPGYARLVVRLCGALLGLMLMKIRAHRLQGNQRTASLWVLLENKSLHAWMRLQLKMMAIPAPLGLNHVGRVRSASTIDVDVIVT